MASLNTNTTTSSFTRGFTFVKIFASSETSNTGFTFGGGLAQPNGLSGSIFGTPQAQTSGLGLGSASQGFTLGTDKTTAPATVNPTQAFTPGSATTAVFSTSAVLGLKSGSAGGTPSPGLIVEATPAATTTSELSVGGGLKLATPASSGVTLGIPAAASSATPVIESLSGLAKATAATATASTTSTGLTLGTAGTTVAPEFSFPAASGFTFDATQTTSLSTATTTGWFFVKIDTDY